jgi:hypothetical protein
VLGRRDHVLGAQALGKRQRVIYEPVCILRVTVDPADHPREAARLRERELIAELLVDGHDLVGDGLEAARADANELTGRLAAAHIEHRDAHQRPGAAFAGGGRERQRGIEPASALGVVAAHEPVAPGARR